MVAGGRPAPSKSLLDYIKSKKELRENLDELADGLRRLKADMLRYEVVTMALYAQNILYKKDKNGFGRFVIIDDIGSAALIPIEYWFGFAGRERVKRRWERFLKCTKAKYHNELVDKLIEKASADNAVVLGDEYFVGQGLAKQCFVYPKNDALCVKIPYNEGGVLEIKRELKYINMLRKRGVECDILPIYYGEISTNMGIGHLFWLVRDYDGKISQSLYYYLKSNIILEANFTSLLIALKELKEKILANEIITMGLFAGNFLCKRESENTLKIILINDLGSAALIPIEYWFSFAARARVKRKWKKFIDYLSKKYTNPLVHELIEQIK
ncbi:MAG: hypothetical protein LBP40_02675 [Campylobacteraceae bacterium]|jgi:hypothetical protein|nr:hypothetical protein [Campylobacteraceae bacterium]